MATLRKWPVPWEAREAFYLVELDIHPTVTELDNMPQELVEKILAYKAVVNAAINGTGVDLNG